MVNGEFYEPFSASTSARAEMRTLRVRPDRLQLTALDTTRGLQCDVEYFTPPERPVGTLVRHMTLTKRGYGGGTARRAGRAAADPAGRRPRRGLEGAASHHRCVCLCAAARGPCAVLRHEGCGGMTRRKCRRSRAGTSTPLGASPVGNCGRWSRSSIRTSWFGAGQGLMLPRCFIENECVDRERQVWENRLACALVPAKAELAPHEAIELFALVGAGAERCARGAHLSVVHDARGLRPRPARLANASSRMSRCRR